MTTISNMDIFYISLCVLLFCAYPSFGEDPLEVSFQNASRVDVSEGAENIHFKCHLNRGPFFVINNVVEMIHVDPISNKESVIASKGNLVDGNPEFYDVKIASDPNSGSQEGSIVDFTILKVQYKDDGKYVCRVSSNTGGESIEAEREIVVHRPLEALHLKFGDFDPIASTPSDPIEIDPGKYKVSCIALGSNPGTKDVHMYFEGEMVPHDEPVVSAMETPERKFSTHLHGEVDIMVQNSGQEIQCQAKDSSGSSLSTKLSISVNTYDPIVHCNDSEAYHGQANPTLFCTVNYTGLEVTGYAYQIGDTGEIIRAGDKHAKNIKVNVDNVAPGIAVVSLDLHKAEHEYLDKHYYILIDIKGGHTSKSSVRLDKVDVPESEKDNDNELDDGNGAAKCSCHAVWSVLMCLLLWWL